ncbi:MAG: hypothetical protein JSW58_03195 [Candidatus Latescibacterota bacterium]|nr:MAG: hypothetical protein JSW58_03195 [Candidatus Latescibacterota bacterium]
MKIKVIAALFVLISASTAGAVVDIAVGGYGGMDIPVANDEAKSGTLFGVHARASVLSFLAVGGYFRSSSFGDPEQTFFEGLPDEFTSSIDGGGVKSFGAEAYVGKVGGTPGVNVFFYGSVGSYKWTRDNRDDISKVAWSVGPGLEIVFPFGLGVEGRGLFQIAPTDNSGSLKSVVWFVGANYHFGLPLK